ncbi:MAG: exosome complex protein Rrp42 [Candidatus Marsarchaeota archaeon]|nr:exosome complex protein Rrp42 [Candidatus Marsarchaeota archaeon]MCL5094495.1 exosome complex protein Rrp42 [Candidatus Marsarchaeota archaeon]
MDVVNFVKTNYIKNLLDKSIRSDSRGLYDFRPINIQANIMENTEGSAQVDLGDTRILCGIKMQVEDTKEDTPDEGNLIVSAELLPLASSQFESGPPSADSIELARVVDRGIRAAQCIDLADLLIEEKKAWTIFIDLYVLNYSGNLFDASYIAAMSALMNTKVPKYEDGKAVMEQRVKKLKVDNIVTSTTFAKINNKIILDPDENEEYVMDARLTIATDKKNIRAIQKGLSGAFSSDEIKELVDRSFEKHDLLKDYINSNTK